MSLIAIAQVAIFYKQVSIERPCTKDGPYYTGDGV